MSSFKASFTSQRAKNYRTTKLGFLWKSFLAMSALSFDDVAFITADFGPEQWDGLHREQKGR